jgi:hypothetical protein
VDGLSHPATDSFHAWLRSYVQSRGIRHPLLDEIIDNPRTQPRSIVMGRLRARIVPLVGRIKVAIERRLPRRMHRTLLRWDRRRRHARLRKLHARLCDRAWTMELQRAGLDGVSDQ